MNYFSNAISKLYDAVSAAVAERVLNIFVRNFPQMIRNIPEMCEISVSKDPWFLKFVPDSLKTIDV